MSKVLDEQGKVSVRFIPHVPHTNPYAGVYIYTLYYRVERKYCPPSPDKLSNLTVKCILHIQIYKYTSNRICLSPKNDYEMYMQCIAHYFLHIRF